MSPQQELTTALSVTAQDVTVHISVHCYFAGAALKCMGSKQIHVTICPLNPAWRDNWLEWNSLKGQNTGSVCCVQWGLWSRQIQYLIQIRSAARRETRKRSEENTAREMHHKTDLKWYEAPWCWAWGRGIFFSTHGKSTLQLKHKEACAHSHPAMHTANPNTLVLKSSPKIHQLLCTCQCSRSEIRFLAIIKVNKQNGMYWALSQLTINCCLTGSGSRTDNLLQDESVIISRAEG